MSPADDQPEGAASQPEPMALAWQLASRKGWVDVDRAVLSTLTGLGRPRLAVLALREARPPPWSRGRPFHARHARRAC